MSRRTEQVAEAIKNEISTIIQRELKDPRLGFVTITRAEVSPDLRHSKVFFSVLGSEEEKKSSLGVLRRASKFLRHELARQLSLRYVPELHFEFDIAIEHGEKIQRLLHQLEEEAKLNPPQIKDEAETEKIVQKE